MQKQIKHIDINEPIYINGAGDLKLGLNIFFLRELYTNSFRKNYSISIENKSDWQGEFDDIFMQNISFHYKHILEIACNIFIGKIWGIKFKKGYKGKLWGNISIGDKVEKLFEDKETNKGEFVELCEGYLFFRYANNLNLSVKIGDQYLDFVETDEELMNYEILEFFIASRDLYLPVAEYEFPEKWKNFSPYEIDIKNQ